LYRDTPVWLFGEGQTGWVLKRRQPVCIGMGSVSQLASLGSGVWGRVSGAVVIAVLKTHDTESTS